MKRFFKTNRKKTPKPPQQPIPPEKPADIAAGPLNLREELDVIPSDGGRNDSDEGLEAERSDLSVPPNEGGRIGPRAPFQDGMDGDHPPSGASTSVIAIGGTGHGDLLASRCSRSLRWNIHPHLYLSPHQPRVLVTLEERPLGERRHPQVCEHISDGVGPHLPCASYKENKRKHLTRGRKRQRKKVRSS